MRRIPFILIILFCHQDLLAQEDTVFRHVRIMKGDIVDFTVDNLDNVYVINIRNKVKNSIQMVILSRCIMMSANTGRLA
jgi:hypothetical protein